MRRRSFGGLSKRYIGHILSDMIKDRGIDFVRDMIKEKVNVNDQGQWHLWLQQIGDVDAVVDQVRDLTNQLNEFCLTNANRGKILGEFAAGLQRTTDFSATPSPYSDEVIMYTCTSH